MIIILPKTKATEIQQLLISILSKSSSSVLLPDQSDIIAGG